MFRERKCLACEGFTLLESTVSLLISSVMTAAVFSIYVFFLGTLSFQKDRIEREARRFELESELASFFQNFSIPEWTGSVEYGFSENEIFVRARGCSDWRRFVLENERMLNLGFESSDGENFFVVEYEADGERKKSRFRTANCGRRIDG